jgi:hypothetical protein
VGCDAVGIAAMIAVMIVGTGAMIAGTGAKSISRPIGRRVCGCGDRGAVA